MSSTRRSFGALTTTHERVFEFTSDALGAQSGVGGGGRYDGLVELLGGKPTPGFGWAAGVERMLLAGDGHHSVVSPLDLFVALESSSKRRAAFQLLDAARSAGLRAQMELAARSLKGQLGHADALDARYVAIVEGPETALKDMQDGGQERIATDTVVHAVLRGLRSL